MVVKDIPSSQGGVLDLRDMRFETFDYHPMTSASVLLIPTLTIYTSSLLNRSTRDSHTQMQS
jgi:hypothetical protein